MKLESKLIFYRIIADVISKESACTDANALSVLEYCRPCIRTVHIVKAIIIDMSNRGINVQEIKHACFGVVRKDEVKALSNLISNIKSTNELMERRNRLLSNMFGL